jgi:flavin reductase (DIM6/NTAB) family NADH-FMN oxidoreductase RutF
LLYNKVKRERYFRDRDRQGRTQVVQDCAFRRSLEEFAAGAAVVTARGRGDDPVGMTMSSLNSVSVDLPLVLFSVDRKALSSAAMLHTKGFAISVLAREQESVSNQFAHALYRNVATSMSLLFDIASAPENRS